MFETPFAEWFEYCPECASDQILMGLGGNHCMDCQKDFQSGAAMARAEGDHAFADLVERKHGGFRRRERITSMKTTGL